MRNILARISAAARAFCASPSDSLPKPRRRVGPKPGRINVGMRHLRATLLVDAGVCSLVEAGEAEHAGGDPRLRVALRILQILPKWRDIVAGDFDEHAIATLRLLAVPERRAAELEAAEKAAEQRLGRPLSEPERTFLRKFSDIMQYATPTDRRRRADAL